MCQQKDKHILTLYRILPDPDLSSAIFPKRPIGSGIETQMLAYHRQNIVTLSVGLGATRKL
jgi:hypothetical protein